MEVRIVEIKTRKLAASIQVVLGGMNYTPAENEYFAEAWRCAVADGSVDSTRRSDYSFELVSPNYGG